MNPIKAQTTICPNGKTSSTQEVEETDNKELVRHKAGALSVLSVEKEV